MKKLIITLIILTFLLSIPSISSASPRPDNYDKQNIFLKYITDKQPNTEAKVNLALDMLNSNYPKWEESYDIHIFDCSEMSEYVKFYLNKCGINSTYCISNKLRHAWIEVPLEDGDKIVIECTNLKILDEDTVDLYYRYNDVRYDGIIGYFEIDWWNSLEYLDKAKGEE